MVVPLPIEVVGGGISAHLVDAELLMRELAAIFIDVHGCRGSLVPQNAREVLALGIPLKLRNLIIEQLLRV